MPISPVALQHRATWTLRAKLVASMLVLFAFIMLGTGALTVVLSRQYLTQQLDNDLTSSSQRVVDRRSGEGPRGGPTGPPPGGGGGVLRVVLQGDAVVADQFGRPINSVVNGANQVVALDARQLQTLMDAGLSGRPSTHTIGDGVGTYRLVATYANGFVVITGVPTAGVDQIVRRLVLLVGGGTLLGLVLVTVGGTYLVRRNLEPLTRVVATARRVGALKLDSGDVALAERVPAEDTDPHTEVGQVGLALNHMLDNVEGALQSRHDSELRVRQFVADASHELRTPLASIRGYAELSRREKEPVPPSVTHALVRVESEALRMSSLVEDLLLLARLDEGRPLERDEVDLSMIAVDAVSDARAASPRHRWQLDLSDEPVTVRGDRARLHQVLTNLLANARTHTPEGTRVVTSVRPEGTMVRLSVTDNGPGIPEALQRNVFERFTRGDDSRSRAAGSTGLGLSIVAAVGQAHGGSVEVSSRPGETTVSVLLPAT